MGQILHLISIGKLKNTSLQSLEKDYIKRLKLIKVVHHNLKDRVSSPLKEEQDICKKISELTQKRNIPIVLLDEKGQSHSSSSFSQWLFDLFSKQQELIFIIGGAFGHHPQIRKKAQLSFSLSQLTWAHQWARVLFIEQIYRAESIYLKHPYHNN